MNNKVVIIGAGGHAKVIADIVVNNNDILLGFLDDNKAKDTMIISNYKVIGKICDCVKIQKADPEIKFVIAIGDNKKRSEISKKYNLLYYTAVHPNATIAIDVSIQDGTVVMANAAINPNTKIGKHCIINTGAIIEHDNKIGDFTHISPNATLAGTVEIGSYTHIGASATVRNNIKIGTDVVIGAGAVVVKDIKEPGTYVGVPAKNKEI